ncbi:MAG TPA: DMT family transporter [Bacilli bacterium]|nr:DMT family transporter [Bacilli bacterium]
MNRWMASLMVLLGGASYGLISPVVKMAYEDGFTPGDVTASQYVFAAVALVVIALFRVRDFKKLSGKDVRLLVLLGLCSTGTSVTYYLALSMLPASMAIVMLFQFVWVVMLIDYIVTRTVPNGPKWMALVMVVIGTMLAVNLVGADWSAVSPLGLLYGFLASITYSLFLYFYSRVRSDVSAWVNSSIVAVASTVAVSFVFPPTFLWNGALGDGLWLWAILIGTLGQVLPPVFFNIGIPKVGGSLAGVLGSIELPVAVVAAYLVLRETVVGLQWLGIVMILVGIVVSELRLQRRKVESSV